MKHIAGCLMALAFCTQSTSAAVLFGMENGQSCGAWTSQHRIHSVKTAQLEAWVFGYLSGWADTLASAPDATVRSRDPLAATEPAAVVEWMNRYCADHALDPLTEALRHLMEEILRHQKAN
jgi:hypothetical protein